MFKPLSLFVGLRYIRAKRRNRFISLITFFSMLGIALGVLVLTTVLSVMNGFDHEIRGRIFSFARQITVSNFDHRINEWPHLRQQIEQIPEVIHAAPFVEAQTLLTHHDAVNGTMLLGIEPQAEIQVSALGEKIVRGSLQALQAKKYGIILGRELAAILGVQLGDKVTAIAPEFAITPAGPLPRFKRFTVVGIFEFGRGFGVDSNLAFIHLEDAQTFLHLNHDVSGLRIKVKDVLGAPIIAKAVENKLPEDYLVTNWTMDYGEFFHAIQLEKTMMFFILLLIIIIAVFVLLSSLIMAVEEKRADIAILRSLGATPSLIMRIFIVQGSLIGWTGTLLGLAAGVMLASNVTTLVNCIEAMFHIHFISSNIYYVNYIPSEIQLPDIVMIAVSSIVLSFLATFYPAWRAAKTQPAEALRYE